MIAQTRPAAPSFHAAVRDGRVAEISSAGGVLRKLKIGAASRYYVIVEAGLASRIAHARRAARDGSRPEIVIDGNGQISMGRSR